VYISIVKNFTNKDIKSFKKSDQNLILNYDQILAKENQLKKSIKKITKQKIKLKNEYEELISERKKISNQVKTITIKLLQQFPLFLIKDGKPTYVYLKIADLKNLFTWVNMI